MEKKQDISCSDMEEPLLSSKDKFYKGYLNSTKRTVVIKKVKVKEFDNQRKEIDREIDAGNKNARNTFVLIIIKYEQANEDGEKMYYIAYEDYDFTLKNQVYNEIPKDVSGKINKHIIYILKNATRGLKFFHEMELIHRNICIENIIIRRENNNFFGKIAQLSMSKSGPKASISQDFSINDFAAPELLSGNSRDNDKNKEKKTVTNKVDIFSMGIVCFYVLTKQHPFLRDGKTTQKNICDSSYKPKYNLLEKSEYLKKSEVPLAKQLIQAMLQYDPDKRPTAKQVLNHPLFWTEDKKKDFIHYASEYIHDPAKNADKVSMDLEYSKYGKWNERFIDSNDITQFQINKTTPSASGLLKALRNNHVHIIAAKNEVLRDHVRDHGGSIDVCFSKHVPNYLFDFYNYFFKYRSYATLKKFYCDCYIDEFQEEHLCSEDINFKTYNWKNHETIIN